MGDIRVLVVEDEGVIARDLISRLHIMGYDTVGPATTGAAAIELAHMERPDVILMDISLSGGMDGIQAATQIKATSNIPVIYVTAYSDDSMIERAKPTTPSGYLVKPFVERELRATIETACYRHKIEEDLRQSREQYRALLEASGAVPWEMDAENMRYTFIGPQCKPVLDLEPEEILSLEDWLGKVLPEDRDKVRDLYNAAAMSRESLEVEYRADLGDNGPRWIRDSVSSSTNPKGETRLRGYMLDITRRKEAELDSRRYTAELKEALDRIRTLHGLLPICAWCKKIRDDNGYWQQVEVYVKEHSEAEFTHSICPDCRKNIEAEMGEANR